ncbi:MAG: SMP-30/gluconolactonase/LRE family protein [Deltaproteobacteria bacterium]|nr:SMP-30/gluconolactonase/LRE family protein [Deltaproteobacteria bacterium]
MTSTGGTTSGTGGVGTGGGGTGGTSSGGSNSGGSGVGGGGGSGGGGSGGAPLSSRANVCPPGPYAASPLPTPIPTPTQICGGFRFTEGPAWFSSQRVLFFSNFRHGDATTTFNGDIVRYVPGGACDVFIPNTGSNGLAVGADGRIVAAVHLTQTVTAFDLASKQATVIVGDYMNKKLSSPNDVTVHSNGTIYFTDPAWELGARPELLPQAIYRRDPTGTVSLIEVLSRPNGITLSPDEKRLYVSNVGSVRVYDLDAAGTPSNGRSFVAAGSDGMGVDCAGNLYLTGNGVRIYTPLGQPIGTINSGSATNVAFGGEDRKILYITGGTQLKAVTLNIPGYPD